MEHLLWAVSLMCLLILLLIFLLKKFNQPYLVAYILAGVLMGPNVLGIFNDIEHTTSIGELGILLLMFFLGMELEIPDRRSMLLRPVIAQFSRMFLSISLVTAAGCLLGWPVITIVMIGILFIFNSTAVVSEYLRRNSDLNTDLGRMILNILLLQDVLLAPVLTLFPVLGGESLQFGRLIGSITGSVIIFLILRSIRNRDFFQPRMQKLLDGDHELQVFAGCFICLGFGLLAELAGLSGAIGSFFAGMLIGRLEALDGWKEPSAHLKSFLSPYFLYRWALDWICLIYQPT